MDNGLSEVDFRKAGMNTFEKGIISSSPLRALHQKEIANIEDSRKVISGFLLWKKAGHAFPPTWDMGLASAPGLLYSYICWYK